MTEGLIEQSMHNLGVLLIAKGDYETAERLLRGGCWQSAGRGC